MKRLLLCILTCCLISMLFAQELKYTYVDNAWDADSLGNHRVLVTYNGDGNIAKVLIPWRRRDANPEGKKIIVEDALSHRLIQNVMAKNISPASGEVYFEPVSGRGEYYIYYMPFKNMGSTYYPKSVYLPPAEAASADWLSAIKLDMQPNAVATAMQSTDAFNSNYPMEIVATEKETN